MTEESQRFNTAKIDAAIREERDRLVVALRSLADKIEKAPARSRLGRPLVGRDGGRSLGAKRGAHAPSGKIAHTHREDPCRYSC